MDERATNVKNQTDVLLAEIEQARTETTRTLIEIQKRLSVDRAREIISNATKGRAQDMTRKASELTKSWGAGVWEMVKDNPIPTAMVGTGIAWLIKNRSAGDFEKEYELTKEEEYSSIYPEESVEETPAGDIHYRPYEMEEYEEGGAASEKMRKGRQKLEESTSEGRERARRMAEQARERARAGIERVGQQARERAYVVRSAADRARYRAREQGRRVKQGFFHTMEENPLAFAGAVFALGAVVGLAVPEAQKEREMLGPKRDELLERARESGREQVEKVKKVAEQATEAAKEEAERQGLAGRETVEQTEQKAKQSAREPSGKI